MTASDNCMDEFLLRSASPASHNYLLMDLLMDLHSAQITFDTLHPFANLKPFSATPPLIPFASASSCSSSSEACTSKSDSNREAHRPSTKSSLPKRIKMPAKLSIPDESRLASFVKAKQFKSIEGQDEGSDPYRNVCLHESSSVIFGVAAKKGRKDVMEDAYTVLLNLNEDDKESRQWKLREHRSKMQAFFAVFDGHGGREAARFAAEKLGENVAVAMEKESTVEEAMVAGYARTDSEFLSKDLKGGACAVSVMLTNQHLVIANVGDCKVVLCRDGKAEALTTLHRASNLAERQRIEDLGGVVHCFNRGWRVEGTLAVTRGFGDKNLKQWVSIRPEVRKLKITTNCEFLILASDGLWDMMNDQEVVDCVREALGSNVSHKKTQDSIPSIQTCNEQYHMHSSFCKQNEDNALVNACNMLIQIACGRGNLDDITVMIVSLQSFRTYESM